MVRHVFENYASALVSGGDSRIHTDRISGLNKYLCPATPVGDGVFASSCTASPIARGGFDSARVVFDRLAGAGSAGARRLALQEQSLRIKRCLLGYLGTEGLAEIILCPSGTDALLTAARLLAAERPGAAMTAILPSASETGTGVPLAAAGRAFDGPHQGQVSTDNEIDTIEVALRRPDGAPLPDDEVDAAYAGAVAQAYGRAVVYLTYGTKTGLIAPRTPPADAEVIVDACQARIDPARVVAYLRLGWPVVVTGSKFFGGPAFSGAVLVPVGRRLAPGRRPPGLGTVLRWTAACDAIERFAPVAQRAAAFLGQRAAEIGDAIGANPALVRVEGLAGGGSHWSDWPSIMTFAMRDARGRLVSVKELRPIYERLAGEGILLGQPVSLGSFGGMRIAIGARDVVAGSIAGTDRLLDAIKAFGQRADPELAGFSVAAE